MSDAYDKMAQAIAELRTEQFPSLVAKRDTPPGGNPRQSASSEVTDWDRAYARALINRYREIARRDAD